MPPEIGPKLDLKKGEERTALGTPKEFESLDKTPVLIDTVLLFFNLQMLALILS